MQKYIIRTTLRLAIDGVIVTLARYASREGTTKFGRALIARLAFLAERTLVRVLQRWLTCTLFYQNILCELTIEENYYQAVAFLHPAHFARPVVSLGRQQLAISSRFQHHISQVADV